MRNVQVSSHFDLMLLDYAQRCSYVQRPEMSLRAKTTKIQICSLQYVLKGGHLTHPGHLRALSPTWQTTLNDKIMILF